MSSIHRQDGKPNYFCAFYDPEGYRRFRSTGTGNSKVAKKICIAIEDAARLARDGKLSNEKALKLVRDSCNSLKDEFGNIVANRAHPVLKSAVEEFVSRAGGELESYTVKAWLDSWHSSKTDASKATRISYRRMIDLFVKFIGTRAEKPITTIQPKQIEDFKTYLGKRVAPTTVNMGLKVLKTAFSSAVRKRQLDFSPAEHIARVETDPVERRPFAAEEIQKLLAKANDDWRTMILLGYYTGMRLQDCASLTWREVNLHQGSITKATQKTGRRVSLPIHDALAVHLGKLAGDDPDAPICTRLHGKTSASLSAQFYDVMAEAGLVTPRAKKHRFTGKGRDGRRSLNRISFHSLRYNTTSALKSAGVGDSVAMDIVGHDTEAVSRDYTDIPLDVKRNAINKLPNINNH